MNTNINITTELIIGPNTIEKLTELTQNNHKMMLVTTANIPPLQTQFDLIKKLCSHLEIIHFDQVIANPTSEIIDAGVSLANKEGVDLIIGIGGGSTIDTAKMIRLLLHQDYNWENLITKYNDPFISCNEPKSVPYIAIPTTTGTGSEVTQAAVITHNNFKESIFHPNNYSDIAILDPTIVSTLPAHLTAMTTFDAFTHAFESYISPKANQYNKQLALSAMKIIITTLPLCLKDLDNLEYREQLLVAQNFAGISLATAGANLPHPLSEVIGSICNVPHGEALAIVFSNFIKQTLNLYPNEYAQIKNLFVQSDQTLNSLDLSTIVHHFINKINLKQSFIEHNVSHDDFLLVLNHPLWEHLPFLDSSQTKIILNNSYKKTEI